MIAALPIKENNSDAVISPRYARTPFYVIINTQERSAKIIENPYHDESTGAGKHILSFLTEKYNVDTLIAFELGLHVHQLAMKKQLQLIIIHEKNKTLKDILYRMNITISRTEFSSK